MNSHAKRNCTQYNQNLVNRGSLTFWFDEECLKSWVKQPEGKGRPSFSRTVIQLGWLLRTIYRLLLRALQGFLQSILNMLITPLTSPNYTLFSKRAAEAADALPTLSRARPIEIGLC